MTQTWHNKYTQGSENLEEILLGLDKNINMWENGKIWTYKEVEKFGPHLPKSILLKLITLVLKVIEVQKVLSQK